MPCESKLLHALKVSLAVSLHELSVSMICTTLMIESIPPWPDTLPFRSWIRQNRRGCGNHVCEVEADTSWQDEAQRPEVVPPRRSALSLAAPCRYEPVSATPLRRAVTGSIFGNVSWKSLSGHVFRKSARFFRNRSRTNWCLQKLETFWPSRLRAELLTMNHESSNLEHSLQTPNQKN